MAITKSKKTETINIRIDKKQKNLLEKILHEIGLTPSEATRIFYSNVILNEGIPFDVKIPNKATLQSLEESRTGAGKRFKKKEDLFESW